MSCGARRDVVRAGVCLVCLSSFSLVLGSNTNSILTSSSPVFIGSMYVALTPHSPDGILLMCVMRVVRGE